MGQVYPTVVSSKCVLLRIKESAFDELIWKHTRKQTTEIKIKHLQQSAFCKDLCDQTLSNIMYEKGKILLFKPGQLILRLHIRSPLNKKGRKLYDEEYGSHMKAGEATGAAVNSKISAADIKTTSAFGNFFLAASQKKKERR